MKFILETPNSIFKLIYVKESFLIIFKLLIEGFEKSIWGISSIAPSFISIIQPFQFWSKLTSWWNMESIYFLFHQIFPREEVVHIWTVFLSVCADQSDWFLTSIRPVWPDYKGAHASLSLSRTTLPCVIVGWVLIFWEVRVSRLVEISMLMMKALNSVGSNPCSHYTTSPLVTNPCTHELASPRRLCPYKRIKNKSKNRKEQSRIADEWLAHESWGLTNWMSVKLFLTD
jgi:hypothetical protein